MDRLGPGWFKLHKPEGGYEQIHGRANFLARVAELRAALQATAAPALGAPSLDAARSKVPAPEIHLERVEKPATDGPPTATDESSAEAGTGTTTGEKEGDQTSQMVRWTHEEFLTLLQETRQGDGDGAAAVAAIQRLLAWCAANEIQANVWKSKNWASLFPFVEHKAKHHWPCVLRTDGKFEVSFKRMRIRPPFDAEEKRRELMRRLNEIQGVQLLDDNISRLPKAPLSAITQEEGMEKFLEVLRWYFEEVRRS